MKSNFKRNLIVGFGFSLLVLLVSSIASFVSIKSLLSSNQRVNHTQEVIADLNSAKASLTDAQTNMRGFLLLGQERYVQQYISAQAAFESYEDKLNVLTVDNPKQQQALRELSEPKEAYFEFLRNRVDDKKNGIQLRPEDLDKGRIYLDKIRTILNGMENQEIALLAKRSANSEKYAAYSVFLIIAAAIIALLISGFFFLRIVRDYNERSRLHGELQAKDVEMAERIKAISEISGQIAAGNYQIRVSDKQGDALGLVGGSLNRMAIALDKSFRELRDQEWLQTGAAELNKVMIGEKSIEQLAQDIVYFIASYTQSSACVLYIPVSESLVFAAGYGYSPKKSKERILFGEGLTGQAAVSEKRLMLEGLTQDNIQISYALGEVIPAQVVALPLIDISLEGVIELASVQTYSTRDLEFLDGVACTIGTALKAAQNRKRVQGLLEETQSQSEELKAQHSELESINAELEAQTEKLQASEEELRVQQEELQQTNEELAERSVLLEERNLEIQKKSEDLELSTRYKSEFLANMSHELRTPLNSILLLSRLLSENTEKNLTDEQTEFARVIQSSGNGLLGLIDEILDLSKIEAGKMELEFMDISIQDLAETMKNLFSEVARQKHVSFEINTDNAPLVIKTDRMRLEQILKNLISNALKFTSEGSVTLEVNKIGDKQAAFAVRDTGIGIPHEKQPLIFEAFQQADGSTKRKYGGTGLGLSISRELAKLLRGDITLKSKVGEGSTFTLNIPISGSAPDISGRVEVIRPVVKAVPIPQLETAEKPYISPSIPDDVDDDRDSIGTEDKVILIVEDDVNFAKSLLEFTRQRGYKGVVSVRGDQALNMALKCKPVGVLLDIQLPIKSGWEVMEELKNNSQTRHIPVHIMSSHQLKQESLLKGAVHFLDKPVAYEQMPEVFKRIEHIINRDSQKVLIIEDNPKHAQALAFFLETHEIKSEIASEITHGVEVLQKDGVDCVILDMGIPDKQAYEILENIKKGRGMEQLPVIVFTGKSLSMSEELRIKKYADSIVVKTAHSYQRMLDEVSLFLHLVEATKHHTNGPRQRTHVLNNVLSGKTVLVVDDDVRNIYSLTKSLETLNMNVITAIDGKEALRMLESHPNTDVVLLDMMMPNMDGYQTATRIRANRQFRNLPVIAVTAKAMTGDREKCINAGASDYITKPVDVDQLLSLLRVWLYDKR